MTLWQLMLGSGHHFSEPLGQLNLMIKH